MADAQITAIASWAPNPDIYTVGYRVYYRTDSIVSVIEAGNAVEVPLTLLPGSVYHFVVRGYNAQGELGPPSEEYTLDLTAGEPTTANPGAPGAPSAMAASVSGPRTTLRWQAPSTGGTPDRYLISVGTRSGSGDIIDRYDAGNLLSVQGELPKGTYYARAKAVNGIGASADSNEVRFHVGRRLPAPTSFAVTWTGAAATFSWVSLSADTAADVPANYVLEVGTTPGASNVASLNVGNTTAFTTEVPSGTYYVRVRAENAEGESGPSQEIEVRAPGTRPGPTGLVSASASGIVDLRWTAPSGGDPPAGYIVEAGSAPGLSDLARLPVGNVTHFTTTAPPGVYYVRVRAIHAGGTSVPTNEIVVRR